MKPSSSIKKTEKGQVLVIVALTFIGMVAIIGLAIDMGYMYISYARLRRAVDAAALAASGEFKRNYTAAALQGAAEQLLYLNLNGVDTADTSIFPYKKTETCDTVAAENGLLPVKDNLDALVAIDPVVCTDPLKKIVRVEVTQNVSTFFLSIVGISTFPIGVTSIAEAATVDVVLAIDTSDSMTYGWPDEPKVGDDRNPKLCNEDDPGGADGYPGSCFPFQDVKIAADLFLNNLYFPYDRVGVVTFDRYATMKLPLTDEYSDIHNVVINLEVYEGTNKCPYYRDDRPGAPWDYPAAETDAFNNPINPCRLHDNASSETYVSMDCPLFYGPIGDEDASSCPTTNIGDGVALAGSILTGDYTSAESYYPVPVDGWPQVREDSLWVLLLLTDGASNSGHDESGGAICPAAYNHYFWTGALCRDDDVLTRHCYDAGDLDCLNATYPPGTVSSVDPTNYDPDDRARDMFDIVAANYTLTFTIGMGDAQRATSGWDINGTPPGETLLKYGAFGTTTHESGGGLKGLYYFGNDPADLTRIFLEIANNLATRINQ